MGSPTPAETGPQDQRGPFTVEQQLASLDEVLQLTPEQLGAIHFAFEQYGGEGRIKPVYEALGASMTMGFYAVCRRAWSVEPPASADQFGTLASFDSRASAKYHVGQ